MSKRIKVFALLMATVMLLTACNADTGSETTAGNSESSTAEATQDQGTTEEEPGLVNKEGFPIVNEEITIRILTQTDAKTTAFTNMNDAPGWKYIEELTGINIEIEEYTADDLKTKLPLIMADPDNMPDILWQATLGEDTTMAYGEQGLLLDMTEYLAEYGPNIQKAFDSDENYEGYARSANGGLYSLPSYSEPGTGIGWMINTRWLENCGVTELPTTLDEFKELLIIFRDNDANGNGDPNDEIPLWGNNTSIWSHLYTSTGMMGSWPYVGAMWSSDEGSTETYPIFMEERYRYCVEFFHSLYDENLINQDYLTTQEDTARRLGDKFGVMPQKTYPTKEELYDPDEWVTIPSLKSDYYDMEYTVAGPSFQTNMAAITSNTEYPEVCVRLLDYMMSLEGSFLFNAPNTEKYDVEALLAAGVSQEVIDLCDSVYVDNVDGGVAKANLFGTYGCRDISQLSEYKLADVEFANNIRKTIYENITVPYMGKVRTAYTYSLKFQAEESDVIAQYQADIDTYVKDKLSQWATGGEELNDETWNAYIKQLQAMNVDALTEVYQAAVNRWYGVE